MTVWLILIVAGYLLGSVPLSYLAARSRGVDLRRHGTKQVGGGNLWRTTSRMLGLVVGLFDFIKGMAMVWIAQSQGLDVAQQLVVGLAVVVGHNWPVFLRFHGGRGVATSLGIIILLPSINQDLTPWITAAFFIIGIAGMIATRRTHIPVLAAMLSLPIVSAALHEPLSVTMGFLAMLLIIIIKRLTAQPLGEGTTISRGRLLLYRLIFDRDIRDRNIWISRQSTKKEPDKK